MSTEKDETLCSFIIKQELYLKIIVIFEFISRLSFPMETMLIVFSLLKIT